MSLLFNSQAAGVARLTTHVVSVWFTGEAQKAARAAAAAEGEARDIGQV